ncbi:MAG: amidase family protein, partial [Calditrichaeota bacterium]|nr:amidase family protein [Calditrichota bacterium]
MTFLSKEIPFKARLMSLILLIFLTETYTISAEQPEKFDLIEATISEIHQAIRSGEITCLQLVNAYLKRIETYDQSTRLNAIVIINPHAAAEAKKLDDVFKKTGKLRPLHGIPVIVKDNYDTKDLQTTGGSLAL